jgi:hypothetical protein
MNLDLSIESSDDVFSQKVLREFGHTLGYIHTNQNREAAHRHYDDGCKSGDGVDSNASNSPIERTTDYLDFNLSSIMLYPIPAPHTHGIPSQDFNYSRSDSDNYIISQSYPQDSSLEVGQYLTGIHWKNAIAGGTHSPIISLGSTSSDLRVVLGLNTLDMGGNLGSNLSIKSYVKNESVDKFTIHLDTTSDCKLFKAGVSWLKLPANNLNMQCGVFKTTDIGTRKGPGNVYARIEFFHHFPRQPVVVAGLSGFGDIDNGKIELSTTNIDCHGFDIHIGSEGNSKRWSAQATWIAFPHDRSDIFTGELRGEDIRGWQGSLYLASSFHYTPAIFTAFTKLEFDRNPNCRVRLKTRATKTGLNWEIAAWADTKLYQVQATYLLIDL